MNDLLTRLKTEMGLDPGAALDPYTLGGLFNRFRPDGDGLERLFAQDAVQLAVLARIRNVFKASAPSYLKTDLYFVMRRVDPCSIGEARQWADAHLAGMQHLADFVGDTETQRAIAMLRSAPGGVGTEDVVTTLVYDCYTDFLAEFQPSQDELFLLKEALYSMANDYYLMGYMLWPAIQKATGLPPLLDPYFEMWRHGVRLAGNGAVTIDAQGA